MPVRPKYSIIAPFFNEEFALTEFYKRINSVFSGLGETFEIIFIDDGSIDSSLKIVRSLSKKDPRIKVISLSRNFGHQIAITVGINYAEGDAVVIIDADLQDPPEVIPKLISSWKMGNEVVFAIRKNRRGEGWFKLFAANIFYRFIQLIVSINIPVDTGDFRLIDRKVVLVLRELKEHNRFMRGLSMWVGFKSVGVFYVRHERFAGQTKYPLLKMVKFATDAIAGFSYIPLQISIYIGFFIFISGFLMFLFKMLNIFDINGVFIFLIFINSLQMILFGLQGEYLARIYDEVRNRPLYIIREVFGQKLEK